MDGSDLMIEGAAVVVGGVLAVAWAVFCFAIDWCVCVLFTSVCIFLVAFFLFFFNVRFCLVKYLLMGSEMALLFKCCWSRGCFEGIFSFLCIL